MEYYFHWRYRKFIDHKNNIFYFKPCCIQISFLKFNNLNSNSGDGYISIVLPKRIDKMHIEKDKNRYQEKIEIKIIKKRCIKGDLKKKWYSLNNYIVIPYIKIRFTDKPKLSHFSIII